MSNVLAGAMNVRVELRKRVEAAIRKLDYHPNQIARSLKSKQTRMLGMVISDITNPFFPQLVRGAEDAAFARGYFLITLNTDDRVERERQILSLLRSRRVDGILLVVAPNQEDSSHISHTVEQGIPVLCLDRIPDIPLDLDSVSVDNVRGAQMCVQHLLMRGHRRIGIITGSLGLRTARDRLKGYEKALREGGLKVDPRLIVEGDFRRETGHRLGKELLLRHSRPTALFVSNGMMAIGVLQALDEMGLSCPEDIALASFDDLAPANVFKPRLTSVVQPSYEIGYRGAELLIQRLRNEIPAGKAVHVELQAELKIRDSTLGNTTGMAAQRRTARRGSRA